jgi:D-glycero-D-manno-heptose 1,7-bisphosphate phosphatase
MAEGVGGHSPPLRPGVFLDRDGTLVREVHHLRRLTDLELLPGVGAALAGLRHLGFALVGVTNQSVVARGLLSLAELAAIHAELQRRLGAAGAPLDAVYFCPHHPDTGEPPWRRVCDCRKPAPGMLQRAAADHGLDLEASFMIGDALTDLQAGWRAGCRTVLVLTGYGQRTQAALTPADQQRLSLVAADLPAAAQWIAAQVGR